MTCRLVACSGKARSLIRVTSSGKPVVGKKPPCGSCSLKVRIRASGDGKYRAKAAVVKTKIRVR
ncbi:MAG TPA: hypothetical protein DCP91_12675 [Eggerthellaceae bacterium]|nr:hypothetical protein [Eggerthellaceae bacterium]